MISLVFVLEANLAKRHLTEQQQTRIADQQKLHSDHAANTAQIVAHYGREVDIEQNNQIIRCRLRQSMPSLVVGDWVSWQPEAHDTGVVTALTPRQTTLKRSDSRGQTKLVAANLDQVMITLSVEPSFTAFLLDSYIAAIELCDLTPIIVLNKTDLLTDELEAAIDALLLPYQNLGYQLILTHTQDTKGLASLKAALIDHVSVFIGQSGVGKSSLIQQLLPNEAIAVGHISSQQKLGRHTTTTSRLYHLPSGGDMIDSPGVREFGLGRVSAADCFHAFVEFRPFKGCCKFRDCTHRHEPDCAILNALKDNHISESRLNSFYKLAEPNL